MADIEKTVAIIFEGDDRVGKTITGISSGLDSLGTKAASATQPFADMAESALKLEAALVALVAGGFALAIKSAGEFADSFNEISTLVDTTDENLASFKSEIVDYSRVSTASLDDINAAVYTAISAGTDYKDSLSLLLTSEKLATAGKADLEATTRLLASTMNAYGAETDQAGQYSDAFFQTVKLGQTTLPELAESMAAVTPLAGQMKVPIETLTSAVAALTATGVPTSQAITQIRSALVAFAKPSSEATKIAEQLGIDFSAAAVSSKGFEVVLGEVYEATGGNVEILAKLFGRVEGLSGALVLGGDENGKFAATLDAMRESAGSTEEAFGKMADNISLVGQNLKNNLEAVLIDFGTPLLNESVDVMNAISSVFQSVSFSFQAGAFDPIVTMVESFGTNLATNIRAIAEALPEALADVDYSGLLKSVESLGGELNKLFSAFFGEIDLSTPEGLTTAIQKVVDGATALTNVVSGIVDAWQPFVKTISAGIETFTDSDEAVQKLVGQFLGWSQVVNTVASNLGILTGALSTIGTALSVMATTNLVKTIAGFKGLTTVLGTAGLGMAQFVAVAGAPLAGWAIGTWLRDNVPIVKEFGDSLGELAFNIINFGTDSASAAEKQAAYTTVMGEAAAAMIRIKEAAGELPSQTTTEVEVTGFADYESQFDSILSMVTEFPDEKTTDVKAEIDKPSFEAIKQYVVETGADGITTIVFAEPDEPSFIETKKEIEEIPSEKLIAIEIQGEIDKEIAAIEAQAAVLQSAFEWKAKLEIAEVEAGAARLETVAQNINDMFQGTGDVLTAMVGALSDASGYGALVITEALEAESVRRDELLVLQKELTTAEIDLTKARTDALESGQGMITISAAGVYPELELVLQSIIERAQIQANAEGMSFLLGA